MEKFSDTYEILGKLGEGSGGIIYKARHKRLDVDVVVKQIKNTNVPLEEKKKETDMLKNIHHSYLPQLMDFFTVGENAYTVMRFIPGKSLQQVMAERQVFEEEEVEKWGIQLCSALSYLHGHQPPIIHSDIKPANIMLTPEGNICLIDFNISFFMDGHTVLGYTNGYTSPEQYRFVMETLSTGNAADAGVVDERTDIYALGATFYHLVTGRKLSGPPTEEETEDLRECVSEAFAEVIERAVRENPAERFQSADEMKAAFEKIPGQGEEYLAQMHRRTVWKIGLGAVAAASIICIGFVVHTVKLARVERYNSIVEKQADARKEGNFDRESELYREAVSLLPSSLESYYQNACALYEQKDYIKCIDFVEYDILKNDRLNLKKERMSDIYYLKADSHFQLEEYEEAVETYDELFLIGTSNCKYYRDFAIALAYAGFSEEAEEVLEEAVDKGLREDSVYYVKGEIEKFLEEPGKAEEAFRKCIETTDDSDMKMRSYVMLSDLYQETDDRKQELQVLKEAKRDVDADNQILILERLAQVNIDLAESTDGSYYRDEAVDVLLEVIQKGWDTEATYNNLVILYQKQGNLDKAERYLGEMKEKFGEDYNFFKRKAFLEIERQRLLDNPLRDYTAFEEYYDEAVELYKEQLDGNRSDMEMKLLEQVHEQVRQGGWI